MKEFGFQWHITNYCNLRCRHCYQDNFTDEDDLDTASLKGLVKKITTAVKDRPVYVNITGGEPFLRDDLFGILRVMEKINNIREYNIITNVLPLDRDKIRESESLAKLKQFKISLECSDSELNDAIRGRGSFKKIMANYELLREFSTKQRVLMFTLGGYNYRKVKEMLEFSNERGADAVILERFVPLGRGAGLRDGYLKNGEWREVVKALISFCDLAVLPNELLAYKAFYVDLKDHREAEGALCNLGDQSMALMPNADVYPCRRLPVKIGNAIKDDFGDILIRLQLLRESLEKDVQGKCGSCPVEDCYGCRAIAYAETGNLYAEDPQCFRFR
jgi:radical SAM protein with 4Fe4S-binding SPASM domain